jgi:hypothetical protein
MTRARPSDQALAVPVEPVARLDPTGFDPSRMDLVRFYAALSRSELEERIAEYDADGIIIGRFPIHRFKDGDDIGLPKWAKRIVIGGFAEQGWAAYDRRRGGKKVASGEWGDALLRLRGGRITSRTHRYYSGILQDALAIAMEARRAETPSDSVHDSAAIAQNKSGA